jgi:hypothetical protein
MARSTMPWRRGGSMTSGCLRAHGGAAAAGGRPGSPGLDAGHDVIDRPMLDRALSGVRVAVDATSYPRPDAWCSLGREHVHHGACHCRGSSKTTPGWEYQLTAITGYCAPPGQRSPTCSGRLPPPGRRRRSRRSRPCCGACPPAGRRRCSSSTAAWSTSAPRSGRPRGLAMNASRGDAG